MNTPDQLDKTLATIAARAKELREAGITGRVKIGEVSFELAGAEPPPVAVQVAQAEPEPSDPLADGITFGGDVPRPKWETRPSDDPDKE